MNSVKEKAVKPCHLIKMQKLDSTSFQFMYDILWKKQ